MAGYENTFLTKSLAGVRIYLLNLLKKNYANTMIRKFSVKMFKNFVNKY